jgi:hypothetical protein
VVNAKPQMASDEPRRKVRAAGSGNLFDQSERGCGDCASGEQVADEVALIAALIGA